MDLKFYLAHGLEDGSRIHPYVRHQRQTCRQGTVVLFNNIQVQSNFI